MRFQKGKHLSPAGRGRESGGYSGRFSISNCKFKHLKVTPPPHENISGHACSSPMRGGEEVLTKKARKEHLKRKPRHTTNAGN
jgi:hypothetical protein